MTQEEPRALELLTMRELVEISGVPRSTIQFYLRDGLLPPPQRLANNRPIFGRIHVELLEQIGRLKAEGLTLGEIRPLVNEAASSSAFYGVDLAQEVDSATKTRILEAAADQFGRRGYQRTRLSDVIKQAAVTPQVFASHFTSKKHLFAESFGMASQRVMERAIPDMQRETDPRRKLLTSFSRLLRSRQAPNAVLWALARDEALYEGGEPADMAQQAYRTMSSLHASELAHLREKVRDEAEADGDGVHKPQRESPWPPVSDELMAYCFLGAEEYLIMRLAWDKRFSREDVLKAYLLLIAAIHAQYDQEFDAKDSWDAYIRTMREELGEREHS